MYREYEKLYAHELIEYDRKSRADDPLLSVEEVLEKHGKMLDEFARNNFGGPIPEENKYKEVGSAESIDNRPEIKRVLKAIESPDKKGILVVDVQRLSRGDLEDAGRLIKLLRYTNTYVITPTKIYDLRDEYDRDAFERELKRGNEYLEYFKKIQARGRLTSVKEGNYVGSVAPYGFRRVKKKDGKRDCFVLEEKEDEANIVRMIFDWYCNENVGVTVICRRLEEMGVKSKSGSKKWTKYTIYSMLENVHYIGCVHWNWRKTKLIVEDQEVRKMRPKAKVDEYLVFDGKHDPIISKELFDKAQEIKGKRAKVRPDTTLKNPFSGVMFCECGYTIGYNTYTKNGVEYARPVLRCNNQPICGNGSAKFDEVYEYVLNALRDCIKDFEVMIGNEEDNSIEFHKKLIKDLEKKIKELEARELQQWESLHNPDPEVRMPPDIFKKLNEKLLVEKEEIKNALCKAYESMPKPVNYKEKILRFTDAIKALEDSEIPASIKNQFLKDIIDRIEYSRPKTKRLIQKNVKGLQYEREPYKITIKLK